jgi:membrane protease YdiL (CAAX protease family)
VVPGTQRVLDGRELAALGLTFGTNVVVHRVLPHETHVPTNLLAAGGVTGIALLSGASVAELGLERARARDGLRAGLVAGAAIAGGIVAAGMAPRTRRHFSDERVNEVGRGRALYELFVRIPFGTALAEELLFRSGLTALFLQRRSWGVAVAVTSAAFGLWHVLPAVESLDTHPVGEQLDSPTRSTAAVVGIVVTTGIAGAMLSVLQRRARSVLAPVIAHAVLNGATYAAARVISAPR